MTQEKIQAEDIQIITDSQLYTYFTYPYSEETKIRAGYGWHGYIEL